MPVLNYKIFGILFYKQNLKYKVIVNFEQKLLI